MDFWRENLLLSECSSKTAMFNSHIRDTSCTNNSSAMMQEHARYSHQDSLGQWFYPYLRQNCLAVVKMAGFQHVSYRVSIGIHFWFDSSCLFWVSTTLNDLWVTVTSHVNICTSTQTVLPQFQAHVSPCVVAKLHRFRITKTNENSLHSFEIQSSEQAESEV